MKTHKILFACLALFLVVSVPYACAGEFKQTHVSRGNDDGSETFEWDEISIGKMDGERLYFDVEMALTVPQQMQGMMYRKEMPNYTGMLVVFDDAAMRSFWMKTTLIPLDMLFIDKNGVIVGIEKRTVPKSETIIPTPRPVRFVLELNGGAADHFGLEVGEKVEGLPR